MNKTKPILTSKNSLNLIILMVHIKLLCQMEINNVNIYIYFKKSVNKHFDPTTVSRKS